MYDVHNQTHPTLIPDNQAVSRMDICILHTTLKNG